MKIKKFTARTFTEVLELVKKELGRDAIILTTEEKKGLLPHVEVTAAVDYDQALSEQVRNQADVIQDKVSHFSHLSQKNGPVTAPSRMTPYGSPASSGASTNDLRNEIGSLRAMIEGMKNNGYELSLPAKKRMIVKFLRERAIREEYALRLCDTISDISEIPLMLSADIKIKRHNGTRKAVMLIGPTGVGKTTTIAKLAAQAVKSGKKAAIINLDTYRIGAAEQSRIYARILGIPLAVATNAGEFRSSFIKFSESRDVVFIDTTGKNPKDEAYIKDMSELCKVPVPLELHLLMSASGDEECMIEAFRSYRNLPIDYIAFTKIDEAVRFGPLYNLLLTYQKPVAYITTGQQVPDDIEYATVKRLAGLIVSRECHQC